MSNKKFGEDVRVKLVLGNGFDLFCGLKTKYADFFEASKNEMSAVNEWKINVNTNIPGTFNYYNVSFDKNLLLNFWFIYFSLLYDDLFEINNLNWCNIEEQIKASLDINSTYNNIKFERINIVIKSKQLKNNLNTNELYLYSYYLFKKVSANFYAFIYEELKVFAKKFGEFVSNQCKPLYYYNAFNTITQLLWFQQTHVDDSERYSIDTFNYTSLIRIKYLVNNINGGVDSPIFGVDNVVKEDCTMFTKRYQRIDLTLDKYNSNYKFRPFNALVLFGHSLSEQDYNHFFPLFDHLDIINATADSSYPIVFAYNIYDENQSNEIWYNFKTSVINIFNAYEKYKLNSNENRLFDKLYSMELIKFQSIKNDFIRKDLNNLDDEEKYMLDRINELCDKENQKEDPDKLEEESQKRGF